MTDAEIVLKLWQSVVLTKEEYKIFCSEGNVKPDDKINADAMSRPKKTYEVRDREYT